MAQLNVTLTIEQRQTLEKAAADAVRPMGYIVRKALDQAFEIRISQKDRRRVKQASEHHGITESAVVSQAIELWHREEADE